MIALHREGVLIEGYASLHGIADLSGDVVHRGAFALSLAGGPSRIAMLFQHESDEVIGVWERIVEDQRGLFVRGMIAPRGPRGRAALRLVRKGLIDGLSIGFCTRRDRRVGPNHRDLLDIDLREVSIVTFPMAPQARLRVVQTPNPAADLAAIA